MRRALLLTVLLLAGCVSGPAAGPAPGAAPAPGDVPEGSAPAPLFAVPAMEVSGGAEPSVMVARDGTVWIGDTSGLVKSTDDGATWESVDIPFLRGLFTDGWALAEDDAERIYVAVTNGQLISLAVSEDKGATWRLNHAVDVSGVADRPWVAARGDGEVAVIYFDTKTLHEACLFSTDGGTTFLTRYVGTQASANAGNAQFGPDGSLYYSTIGIVYRWRDPCVGEPTRFSHSGDNGAQIFVQVAVNERGDVFVARPTGDNGRMTLWGIQNFSGRTLKILTVSPPELRSNTFATLSAQGDEVAVAWYGSETAGDPRTSAGAWRVHVARVDDLFGAATVVEQTLTTEPNHVGGFCMDGVTCSGDRDLLDYFMVDHAPDGALHVAYGADGAGSRAKVHHVRLAPLA